MSWKKQIQKKNWFGHERGLNWPVLEKQDSSLVPTIFFLPLGILSTRFRVTIRCVWHTREDGCPRQGSRDWLPQSITRVVYIDESAEWENVNRSMKLYCYKDWCRCDWWLMIRSAARWFSPDHWLLRWICRYDLYCILHKCVLRITSCCLTKRL